MKTMIYVMHRYGRSLLAISVLASIASCGSEQQYDVTSRFPHEVATTWCTAHEGFIVKYESPEGLVFRFAGGKTVPPTIERYLNHPTDWHTLPPNSEYAGSGFSPVHVVAPVPPRSRLKFHRIIEHHRPSLGPTLDVDVVFEGELSHFGPVSGVFLLKDFSRVNQLKLVDALTRCQ